MKHEAGEKQGLKRRVYWSGVVALALLMTACLPGGGKVPQDPLLRSLERKSGLIVYIGADGNIYTIDQGGGNQTAVTTDAGSADGKVDAYQFPTWSPDAQKLAFAKVSRTSGGAVETARVYTAERDGTGLVEAYVSDKQFPIYLYWSPDSQRLSFLTSAAAGGMMLQVVPAQGGEALVLDAGAPYYWTWAPDGQSILVHVGGATKSQPRARLSFLSINGEVIEEGLALRPTEFQAPAWSPDGNQLLLAAETEDGDRAFMLTDSSGGPKSVLKLLDGSIAFGWSPDSKRVAYITGNSDQQLTIGPLTVLDPEKPAEAKTTVQDDVFAFFWSPDGQEVAFFVPRVIRPTPEPNQSGQPQQILLLQLHVLDVKSGESREVTTFLPTREFVNVLPYFDQYQLSTTIWSPDSKNVVLSGYPVGNQPQELGVWVVAASGNLEPRYLTEGPLAFWSWK